MGDYVIHIAALSVAGHLGLMEKNYHQLFTMPTLNPLIEAGPDCWRALRNRVQALFSLGDEIITKWDYIDQFVFSASEVTMHLPIEIGDYTDFYSSEYHASNVGAMFRDPANALLPNWKHLPVGYHGRSSSIVVSGTNFHRPKGQVKSPNAEIPSFSASNQMDMELETAFVVAKNTNMGSIIDVDDAEEYIFGMMLFNDWSARDIQSWEYVPLGPFLGKNFCSSVSPWIVTMDALKPFRVPMPEKMEPEVLPYLSQKKRWTYDIELEAELILSNGNRKIISQTNQKHLYWSMNQQLAHHSINGCPMRVGDLLASGTISGPTPESLGCLLEITKRGKHPIDFPTGEKRTFMEDGDGVVIRGYCQKDDVRVGFGEAAGTVLPAL